MISELSGIQEYSSMNYCLQDIPRRVRRAFAVVDVQFTCFDVVDEFLAVGTNVGVVYWCNRKTNKTERLRPVQDTQITAVKVVSTVDYMVACGDKIGIISVFIIPKENAASLPSNHLNRKKTTERFTSAGLHEAPITAIEWSVNGQKLFTGDDKGLVVLTEVDFQLNITKSSELLNEKFSIVQLHYQSRLLLVASEYRCIIYNQSTENKIHQVGQRERTSLCKLGAIIGYSCDLPGPVIFSARPNQRIWLSNVEGLVFKTFLFKEALSQSFPEIPISCLLNDQDHDKGPSETPEKVNSMMSSVDSNSVPCSDIEFNYFQIYKEKFIIAYSETSMVFLNIENTSVETGLSGRKIISVAVNKEEVFILERCRRIRRLSYKVDPYSVLSETSNSTALESLGPKILNMVGRMKEETITVLQPLIENFVKMEENVEPAETLSPSEEALDFVYSGVNHVTATNHNLRTSYNIDTVDDNIVYREKQESDSRTRTKKTKSDQDTFSIKSESTESSQNSNQEILNLYKLENLNQATIMQEVEKNEKFLDAILKTGNTPVALSKRHDLFLKTDPDAEIDCILSEPPSTTNWNLEEEVETNAYVDKLLNASILDANVEKENETHEIVEPLGSSWNLEEEVETNAYVDELLKGSILNTELENGYEANLTVGCDDLKQKDVSSFSGTLPVPSEFLELNANFNDTKDEPISITDADAYRSCYLYWKQFKVPFLPRWMCITNDDIFCGSQNHLVFHSASKLPHKWTKEKNRMSKISASPSGRIRWRLDVGIAYAYLNSTHEWKLVARNVKSIAVSEFSAWYINEGRVYIQTELNEEKPFNESHQIRSTKMSRISCFNHDVWALSNDGEIFYRENISERNPTGTNWKLVNCPDNISVLDIALCTRYSGWVIDSHSNIYFTNNFKSEKVDWWQITIGQKSITSQFALRNVVPWTKKKSSSPVIVSNDTTIYLSLCDSNKIYMNRVAIMGHRWIQEPVQSRQIKWKFITADTNSDSVWCLSISNDLFLYSTKGHYRAVEVPTTEDIACLSGVPEMLWLLTKNGKIYVRRGISTQTPFGWTWEHILVYRTASLVSSFKQISVNNDVIWALGTDNTVYAAVADLYAMRTDSFMLDWVQIENPPQKDSIFTKVIVGPDKRMVWALDNIQNVYIRHAIFDDFPFGAEWLLVPEIRAAHLTICRSAVWAVTGEGFVYRRSGIKEENCIGEYWSLIPGSLSSIAASISENLWGISKINGCLMKHECNILLIGDNPLNFQDDVEEE